MSSSNQLFSVHVWAEEVSDGQIEWRGRVNTLPDGSIVYFRTWDALINHMQGQLSALTSSTDSEQEPIDKDSNPQV